MATGYHAGRGGKEFTMHAISKLALIGLASLALGACKKEEAPAAAAVEAASDAATDAAAAADYPLHEPCEP